MICDLYSPYNYLSAKLQSNFPPVISLIEMMLSDYVNQRY